MNSNTNRKYYYAFFAVALCALIVPLYLVEVPPLVDLPNHLARLFVLENYDKTPFFQQNFEVVYEPIPNMALDLIMIPLLHLFDIWTSNRLFLALTIVLFAFGCHLISRGKDVKSRSFSAVIATFLIYSGTFFYGYINYVFSVALFLIAFGLWLKWREKLDVKRFLALAILTSAIYLAHLSAFVFFGGAIFIVNLYDYFNGSEAKPKWTSFAADAGLFVLPTIAFLAFMGESGDVGVLGWNSLNGKAVALFSAFRSYDLWIDLLCVAMVTTFFFLVKNRKEGDLDKRILAVAICFFLIFLVSPKIFFTGDADLRIVLPAFALLILSCKVNVLSGRVFVLFAVTVCLLTFRQAAISYRWIQISEKLSVERNLLDVIAPESKIYMLFANESSNGAEEKFERPIRHVVNFATMKNSSFAPTLFAIRGQQPLVFRQPGRFASLENADKTKWIEFLGDYDYVWSFGVPQSVSDELEKRGKLVAEEGKTKIWKLYK